MKQAFLNPKYDTMYNQVFIKGKPIVVVGVIISTKSEIREEPLYLCKKHYEKDNGRSYLHVIGDEVWESFCGKSIEDYIDGQDTYDGEEYTPYTRSYAWALETELQFVEGNANAKHVLETWED